MTAHHAMTKHNERYSFAPVTHPAIGQQTWFCHEDGSLLVDLELHDKFHDEVDELKRQLHELTNDPIIPKEEPSKPSSTIRSTSKVRVQETP